MLLLYIHFFKFILLLYLYLLKRNLPTCGSFTLSEWSMIQVPVLVYEENLVGRKELILCVQQVSRWILIATKGSEYLVPIT